MADDCCDSFGGRISITINGEQFAPTDGDIVIDPTRTTVTGGANHDGSAFYASKPKLYKADIKFRNKCGIVWDEVMLRCRVDVTIVEEDTDRTHIFTGARITGEAHVNLSNGEVEGLAIEGPKYQRI